MRSGRVHLLSSTSICYTHWVISDTYGVYSGKSDLLFSFLKKKKSMEGFHNRTDEKSNR